MSKASLEIGGGNWAAKDTKLLGYAVGDTSGKYLPREFTFSRGADIGATRVNKDGLIEKYRENLLLRSNQFDTSWTSNNTTETGGQAGYDGTSDGWLLAKTAADGETRQSVDAGLRTFSVYAKAGSLSWMYFLKGGNAGQYFNLGTGVLGSPTGVGGNVPLDAKIENVGGGWYRCSMTYNDLYAGSLRIYPADGDNDTSGTTGNIYIQDAQLEYGLVATDYLESGSTTGKAGVLDNLPRIDYTSGSAQLLMEPSRTNYIEHSEYFNAWTKQAKVTITDNATTSPSGYNDASKYNISGSTDRALDQTETLTSGVTYTFSMWVKAIVDTQIRVRSNGNEWSEIFTVLVSDGWKRIESTHTMVSTSYEIGFFDVSGSTGDRFYIWGAQLEEGSYATSYIPNYGTALGVSRAFDYFDDQSYNDVLGNGDISMLVDFDYAAPTREDSTTIVSLRSGSDILGIKGASTTDRRLQIYSAGNFSGNIDFNQTEQATRIKALIRTNGSTVELFFNGAKDTETITFPAVNLPYAWDDIRFTGSNSFLAKYNRIAIFTDSLSDAECIALTTV